MPPPGRCKYLFPPRGPRRGHLPASLPLGRRGRFPAHEQQPGAAAAGSGEEPLLMLFRGAPPRPPAVAWAIPCSGQLPSAPAQCLAGGGAQIPVSGGGGGGDRQFSQRRSTKRTRWRSPSLSPDLNPPPGSPGISPRGVPPPPRRCFLGSSARWKSLPSRRRQRQPPSPAAPGSVPAVPERRCRRHRRSPPPAALGPGWVELRCPRTSSHCSART